MAANFQAERRPYLLYGSADLLRPSFFAVFGGATLTPVFRVFHPRRRATSTLSSAPRKPFQRNNGVFDLFALLSQISQNFSDIHRIASKKHLL
jgi:hypothetical protein